MPRALLLAAFGACGTARALGQCEPAWLDGRGAPGTDGGTAFTTFWDPDGPGGETPRVIVGGFFSRAGVTSARALALWDGRAWSQFVALGRDDGSNEPGASASVWWDPDGDGPASPLLVIAGIFDSVDNVPAQNIAAWDGAAWRALGPGIVVSESLGITELTTWDADGDGPAPALLVAAGYFPDAGAGQSRNVAAWDGLRWLRLGDGVGNGNGGVSAVVSHDWDGDGPLPPRLIVGGTIQEAGGVAVRKIAQWDGTAWTDLGTGFDPPPDSTIIETLLSLERPGSVPVLYAGGYIKRAAGLAADGLVEWREGGWRPAAWQPGRLHDLTTYDADGAGGAPPVVLGTTAEAVYAWDGVTPVVVGIGRPGARSLTHLDVYDADGAGGATPFIGVAGSFSAIGRSAGQFVTAANTSYFNGTDWHGMGGGSEFSGATSSTSARLHAFASWDSDGSGPRPARLVAAGEFRRADEQDASSVAYFEDDRWHPLPALSTSRILAVREWDPDGAGPAVPLLVVTKLYAPCVYAWDGTAWATFGGGLSAMIPFGPSLQATALEVFDLDGDGPQLPSLIVGGSFWRAGTLSVRSIVAWNGSQWTALGTLNHTGETAPVIADLQIFDADGPGPEPATLYACGGLDAGNGVRYLVRWNGSQWVGLPGGVPNGAVSRMTTFDLDGPGPERRRLVVSGDFTSIGGVSCAGVAAWDGAGWRAIGTSFVNEGRSTVPGGDLATFDPDGPGPMSERLYVGGLFDEADGRPANRIAVWDGQAWRDVEGGLTGGDSYNPAGAMFSFDADGAGGQRPVFYVGGAFAAAGGKPSAFIARLACGEPACPADIDANGQVDFFDYLDFAELFSAEDPRADFDGNDIVDFFDYLAFARAYDEGCE